MRDVRFVVNGFIWENRFHMKIRDMYNYRLHDQVKNFHNNEFMPRRKIIHYLSNDLYRYNI